MDLVTFTEEILNEKLHFLCSVGLRQSQGRFKIFHVCVKKFFTYTFSKNFYLFEKSICYKEKKNLHFSKKPRFFEMEKMFYTYLRKLN